MRKMIISVSLLIFVMLFCSFTNRPVAYSHQTITYTVQAGDTGHKIAYKYMDRQDKYEDVREFWFYISEDSKLDKRVPLQVGQKLTINLYKSRR